MSYKLIPLLVTRTSFDMDPFVVTTLGRKTFRTRVVRHNLNPVYDEKLVFHVLRNETGYSLGFTVVDRDSFSGNDYVGAVNLPLADVISAAPEADPETGLYNLPDPQEATDPVSKKSRFRLPLSRSASSQSLHKLSSRPQMNREPSKSALSMALPPDEFVSPPSAPAPTSVPAPTSAPSAEPFDSTSTLVGEKSPAWNNGDAVEDPLLKSFELPLDLKNKDRWEDKHKPILYIRAKYLPYRALRQQFWRGMLKQYDADESGRIDKVELTTMLDTLGSTLHESTIDGMFDRFAGDMAPEEVPSLSFDQAVICLEDQLQRTATRTMKALLTPSLSRMSTFDNGNDTSTPPSGSETPLNWEDYTLSQTPSLHLVKEGDETPPVNHDDLHDESGEEHVIEIRECPICHQPRLNKRTDADIITHVATCASQDWRQVNNIVMAGFVTSSQAHGSGTVRSSQRSAMAGIGWEPTQQTFLCRIGSQDKSTKSACRCTSGLGSDCCTRDCAHARWKSGASNGC